MVSEIITIELPEGFHARPASEFAKLCAGTACKVTVGRPDAIGVRGDSVLSLLTIAGKFGEKLVIQVIGEGEMQLLNQLKTLVSGQISR